jgi:hypothetical protein
VDACGGGNVSSGFKKGREIPWSPSQQLCSVEIGNNKYNGRDEVRVAYLTVDPLMALKEKLGSS